MYPGVKIMHTLIAAIFLMLASLSTFAQTSQGTAFTYQGQLSQTGMPTSGNVDMVFDLFDAATGGNAIGPSLAFTTANGNPIFVQAGVFDATLDFGSLAFNGITTDQRFLRITVNGTSLAPRTPIQNAPYALQSRTSELAYNVSNGVIGTAQINAAQVQRRVTGACASGSSMQSVNADGTVACQSSGAGTITAVVAGSGLSGGGSTGNVTLSTDMNFVQKRVNGSCASGSAMRTVAVDGTVTCESAGAGTVTGINAGRGLTGGGSGGVINLALQDPLTLLSNQIQTLYIDNSNESGAGLVVNGINRSINAISSGSESLAVLGLASAPSGITVGVYGQSASSEGTGVEGYATSTSGQNYGVYGSTDSPVGYGVYGLNGKNAVYGFTSIPGGSGVRGEVSGASGDGVSGINPNGTGVHGIGVTAVRGEATAGIGVFGSATTLSSSEGVRGTSTSGIGVHGIGATGVEGETSSGNGVAGYYEGSSAGSGVYGQSSTNVSYGVQGNSNPGVGVYGQTSTGTGVYGLSLSSGLAGKFVGNVQVTGTLSKAAGSFQIDHPLDPANKYLYHSFVESPDMKNIYDGVATFDDRGEAWVELPAYFEALNRDFRYQLTALDVPAPSLFVAARIEGNRFKLAGGQPGQQVSWQVTGTRKDAYAEAHRIVPEVVKPASERGKYLHPDLFGKTESMAVFTAPKSLDSRPSVVASPTPASPPKLQQRERP
jgi:hypothetical protein